MRRRRRGLLRMYYGVDDSVQVQQDNPLDIDKAGFKADMFMEKMLKETSLNNLYKQEERMKKGMVYTRTILHHIPSAHTHTHYPPPIPSAHTLTTLYPYPQHTHTLYPHPQQTHSLPSTHTLSIPSAHTLTLPSTIDRIERDWKRKYPRSTIRVSPGLNRGLFPTWS